MTVYLRLTIGGVDHEDYDVREFRKNIASNNATSRLGLEFPNYGGRHKTDFTEGEEVVLYAEQDVNPPTTKVFGGFIVDRDSDGKGPSEKIILTCRDYANVLQMTTVEPEVYNNQEISLIVSDLLTKYGPADFTQNNIFSSGRTLVREVFSQINLFDAIKKLAEKADFIFYVDEDKDVHFKQKGTTSSGLTFDSTNVRKSRFRRNTQDVRNNIFVYGSRQLIASPAETFTANGAGSVFTVAYEPNNTLVSVSGVQKVGDVFKGDNASVASGVNYLVNYDDKKIIFVSGTSLGYSSIPASGTAVVVSYQRSRPIIKQASDEDSIRSYRRRTKVIVDENINDPRTARDVAVNQLDLFSKPLVSGDIVPVGVAVVNPGDTCTVNLPYHNIIAQEYEILEVKYDLDLRARKNNSIASVKVSQRIANIADVLKDLILAAKALEAGNVGTDDILSRLFIGAGSVGLRSNFVVRTQSIGNSFIMGHPINGLMGSPHIAVNGSQILMGDHKGALSVYESGGTY